MKSMPRLLPLVGVAIGGVLAVNAIAGARDLPHLLSNARAYAEEAAAKTKPAKGAKAGKSANPAMPADPAATGQSTDAVASVLPPPTIRPQAVCAPTAAELAKEAGLSPAELQVLQNLGARRGQLDQREDDLNTQLALMAAAEAKLDAKVQALNGLKADVQNLLTQADGREAAEVDRLVKVFEGMKPKDAAPRMVLLDDSVLLPIAAKMKPRSLSAILVLMPPSEAKKLTESLAKRFGAAQALAANAAAQVAGPAAPAPAAQAAAPGKSPAAKSVGKRTPGKQAKQGKKGPARKPAPADAQAAATPPPAAPTGSAAKPAAPTPTAAAAPPAKAG